MIRNRIGLSATRGVNVSLMLHCVLDDGIDYLLLCG
jgi:hypothetical protein